MNKIREVLSLLAHLGQAITNDALFWHLGQIFRVVFK